MAGVSAQGLTFSFGNSNLTITSFSVNETEELIDGSHLGIAPGGRRQYVGGFAADSEVTCDYISTQILAAGSSGNLSITGPISYAGVATVQSASISGSVGALISGSATFRVS